MYTVTSKLLYQLVIHPTVDDGIVHAVAHGKPVNDQVDVLGIWGVAYPGVTFADQEVSVLRQPAQSEYYHHYNHHLHHLVMVWLVERGWFSDVLDTGLHNVDP